MLNVAIVGMGHIGHTHARCYSAIPECKVVAVVDMLKEKADEAAQRYGCRAFTTVAEMMASGLRIDAASMTTGGKENGGAHYEPTMELLRAGVPTLGEKPISNEIAKAREMVATARERNLPYAINLNHRFTPAARRAKEWLDADRLGAVNHVLMRLWLNNPNDSAEHFHMRALHPHSLDVMRYFGGEVTRVHAFFKKGDGRASWTNVQVNLLFEGGALGHLLGSYDGGPGFGLETCEVVGQKGRFILDEVCERLTFNARLSRESESHAYLGGMTSFGDTFQSRIQAWVDDLRNATPPDRVDGKAGDALKAQLIIEAAIESWEKGAVVEVSA
jgi:predicted dehydrogenase